MCSSSTDDLNPNKRRKTVSSKKEVTTSGSSGADPSSEEEKFDEGEQILLILPQIRPRTSMGPQGDHVTAYALIQEALYTTISECPAHIAIPRLVEIVSEIKIKNSDYTAALQSILEKINILKRSLKYIQDSDIQELQNHDVSETTIQVFMNASIRSNVQYLTEIADEITEVYLKFNNLRTYATFPREGNVEPPGAEGPRIAIALRSLRELNNQATKKLLNQSEIQNMIKAVFETFWYPKIPANILINLTDPNQKSAWEELRKKRGYNIGTIPRNNDETILADVAAEHIKFIFNCFPQFYKTPYYEMLINGFLQAVGRTGEIEQQACHWDMQDNAIFENFLKVVKDKISATFYPPKLDESSASYSSPSSADHQGQPGYDTSKLKDTPSSTEHPSDEEFQPKTNTDQSKSTSTMSLRPRRS